MDLPPFPPRDQQVVDPEAARLKFDREVGLLRVNPEYARAQGIEVCAASFPEVRLHFLDSDGLPRLGGVLIARNYNYLPPSLIFTSLDWSEPVAAVPSHNNGILAGHPESQLTFVCLEGFLEYHEHPSHYDNPWDRHRGTVRGTLWYCMYQARRRLAI